MASTKMASTTSGLRSRRVFVSRLAPITKKKHLLKLFSPYGAERAVVIRRRTGNLAFVTFKSREQAIKVVAMSSEVILHKRRLRILMNDSWHKKRAGRPHNAPIKPELGPFPGCSPSTSASSMLPEEIIAHVASFLEYRDRARLESVSRLWRAGSLASHTTTTTLDSRDWRWGAQTSANITDEQLRWVIIRTGRFLQSLCLVHHDTGALDLAPQIVTTVARHCHRLCSLDLIEVVVHPAGLKEIAENIKGLKELSLGKCVGPTDPNLRKVFEENNSLLSIRLINNSLTGKCLSVLSSSLTKFSVYGCHSLKPEYVSQLIRRQNNLATLEMGKCSSLYGDQVIRAIVENVNLTTTLRTVNMHDLGFIPLPESEMEDAETESQEADFLVLEPGPADAAVDVPSAMRGVENLAITFCGWVNAGFVNNLGLRARNVVDLDISGCSNIRGPFALEPLRNFDGCRVLRMSFLHPEVGGSFLRSLTRLRKIECSYCQGVNDEDLCNLLMSAPDLEHVNVEGCRQITRTLVIKAYDTVYLRASHLDLYVSGTRAKRNVLDRLNPLLQIHYEKQTPNLDEQLT